MQRPAAPVDAHALREAARAAAAAEAFDYLDGGVGGEYTMRANRAAFAAWRTSPRMLAGNSERDLAVTVAGQQWPTPVAAAPLGVLDIVHRDGELAVARARATLGMTMVLSTQSSTSLEDVAEIGGPRWYQLATTTRSPR